jgi:hypothetical protein
MSTYAESVTDNLPINDVSNGVYVRVKRPGLRDALTIGQVLAYQFIPDPKRQTVQDSITVATSATTARGKPGRDGLHVTETIGLNFDREKSVTESLSISDSVTAYMLSQYFINPAVVVPSTPGNLKLVLGSTTLLLRKPDFGDTDSYEVFRIQRESRGGDLQIFQDTIWPTTEILDFKFSYLDPPVAAALLAFLTESLGAQIDLYDQYGRHWQGFILTPTGDVVQDKRTTFTAAFRFQGVLLDS